MKTQYHFTFTRDRRGTPRALCTWFNFPILDAPVRTPAKAASLLLDAGYPDGRVFLEYGSADGTTTLARLAGSTGR